MPDTGRKRAATLPPTQNLKLLDRRFPMFRLERLDFLAGQAALGDITHFRMGPFYIYFINHPDLIRDVLVVNAAADPHPAVDERQALQDAWTLREVPSSTHKSDLA